MGAAESLVDLIAERLEQVSVSEDAHAVVEFACSDDGLEAIAAVIHPDEIMRALERCGKAERLVSADGDVWRVSGGAVG